MNEAELARYNLARLVAASGREPVDIAIRAWPLTEKTPARTWSIAVDVRRKRIRRYLGLELRDGKPVAIPLRELGNLARALECDVSEFLRPPANQPPAVNTEST